MHSARPRLIRHSVRAGTARARVAELRCSRGAPRAPPAPLPRESRGGVEPKTICCTRPRRGPLATAVRAATRAAPARLATRTTRRRSAPDVALPPSCCLCGSGLEQAPSSVAATMHHLVLGLIRQSASRSSCFTSASPSAASARSSPSTVCTSPSRKPRWRRAENNLLYASTPLGATWLPYAAPSACRKRRAPSLSRPTSSSPRWIAQWCAEHKVMRLDASLRPPSERG